MTDTETGRSEKLSDVERDVLVRLLIDPGCVRAATDWAVCVDLLRKLSGVDTVVWVEKGRR